MPHICRGSQQRMFNSVAFYLCGWPRYLQVASDPVHFVGLSNHIVASTSQSRTHSVCSCCVVAENNRRLLRHAFSLPTNLSRKLVGIG